MQITYTLGKLISSNFDSLLASSPAGFWTHIIKMIAGTVFIITYIVLKQITMATIMLSATDVDLFVIISMRWLERFSIVSIIILTIMFSIYELSAFWACIRKT